MIVAGVMSGTSADGIDVALLEFSDPQPSPQALVPPNKARSSRLRKATSLTGEPSFKFLGHAELPYPADVRRLVLASMNSPRASVADLARLNFLLGDLYAEAVLSAQKKLKLKAELVGCHGQTLYHQGRAATFLGRQLAVTWQVGDGSRMAVRLGVPVVSDFRPADIQHHPAYGWITIEQVIEKRDERRTLSSGCHIRRSKVGDYGHAQFHRHAGAIAHLPCDCELTSQEICRSALVIERLPVTTDKFSFELELLLCR